MRRLATVTLVVPDYDAALEFYVGRLGFDLIADVDQGDKRWVVVSPGPGGANLLLARAKNVTEAACIGSQAGGHVGLFLETDAFARDHAAMRAAGVTFEEPPRHETYGIVAVWRDPFGNR